MSAASFRRLEPIEPMTPMQILFGLRGRIPRKTFWFYGVLGPLAVSVYVSMLLSIAGVREQRIDSLVNTLLLWPALAVSAKRWHDRDKSGWWVLIQLVPALGLLWTLIENGFLRGTVGANRFGEDLTGRL